MNVKRCPLNDCATALFNLLKLPEFAFCFESDIFPAMSMRKRINWSARMILKTIKELFIDLRDYYICSYPILLILGAIRRLRRRLKIIWVPRGRGRPPLAQEIVDLILDMKRENWGWGALRISQELALLGIKVHKKTVARILKTNGFVPPRTRMTPIGWGAFIQNHKHIFQLDFTTVFDIKGRQIFILGIIDYHARFLFSLVATLNPAQDWIIQQICNATPDGFELEAAVIADHDGIFGQWLETDLKRYFGFEVYRTPYRQPWKNGRIERFFLSIKSEIFDRVEIEDVFQARRLCAEYNEYYDQFRPHQSLNGAPPCAKAADLQSPKEIKYRKVKAVGGLITKFELAA
jgi:putative transposase